MPTEEIQVSQGDKVEGQEEQNTIENTELKVVLDSKEFQKVLNDYFYNKEEQEKQQKEKQEEIQEQNELLMQKIENQEKQLKEIKDILKDSSLLSEVKTLNKGVQYGNNQVYFSIVVIGVILVSVLMYKFIKIFI